MAFYYVLHSIVLGYVSHSIVLGYVSHSIIWEHFSHSLCWDTIRIPLFWILFCCVCAASERRMGGLKLNPFRTFVPGEQNGNLMHCVVPPSGVRVLLARGSGGLAGYFALMSEHHHVDVVWWFS